MVEEVVVEGMGFHIPEVVVEVVEHHTADA